MGSQYNMESSSLPVAVKQKLIHKTLLHEGVLAKGVNIPRVSQTPYIMPIEQYKKLSALGELVSSALEKFLRLYVESENVQALFPELEHLRKFSCIRPESKYWILMSRFDFIESLTGDFKMLETNSVAPLFLTKTFVKKICRQIAIPVFPDKYVEVEQPIDSVTYFPMNILAFSEEVLGTKSPNIALLASPKYNRSPSDIALLERVLKSTSLNCVTTSIAELQVGNDCKIYAGETPVDVLYQKIPIRVNERNQVNFGIEEFSQEKGELFYESLQKKNIVLANNFVSVLVAENKRILAMLKRPEFQTYFTEAEQKAILELIPETYCFDATNQNQFLELLDDFLENQVEWVIKSSYGNCGINVWIGTEVPKDVWKNLVQKLPNEPYVIQRRIFSKPSDVLTCDCLPQLKPMYSTVSLHVIRGKHCGIYCRSSETLISSTTGGGCQRISYILRKK